MRTRIGLKLVEQVKEHGTDTAYAMLQDAIRDGRVDHSEISLLEMAGSFMGENWEQKLTHYYDLMRAGNLIALRESADAVDASGFAAIGGQLLVDRVKERYKIAVGYSDKLITREPVGNNLGTYIEPYLSHVLDEGAVVNSLQPYPYTQFTHQYTTFPAPVKKGRILAIAMEMLKADKTGQAMQAADSLGERMGLQLHKDRLRVILGITNNYIFNGTGLNTYLTAGSYINSITNFTLTNWRSLFAVNQLWNQMADPVTGEIIDVQGGGQKIWLTAQALSWDAKRILNATTVRAGDITTGLGDQTESANPIEGEYSLIADPHMRRLLTTEGGLTAAQADTYNVFGNFKKAFVEREVYPLTITQAAPNNILEFTRDIALAVKGSMFNVQGVRDPRFVIRAYNASA
jgi:hypothetical protein